MATATTDHRTLEPGTAREGPAQATTTQPVLWWALIGAAFLAFSAYVIIAWVSGPNFESVPSGPDDPPGWMKAVHVTWTAVGIPATFVLLYFVLVRPWRRDGRPSTDGLMAVCCLLLVVQDPWSSYFQHWFTYNSWLPNQGSWVNEIPGWMAFGEPGRQVPEPILWSPFMYCYAFFAITVLGCVFMRKVKARWPATGAIRLFGACCLFMFFVDFVLEGVLFLSLGFYTYAGGHWSIFPDAYHKFPAHEALTAGTMFAVMSSIRYYVDDRGSSLAERGIDSVRGSEAKRTLLRFLAIFGAFSTIVLLCYNIPQAGFGANSTAWPEDVQKRSYLMNGICGHGTDRACPGPGIPLSRGSSSIHLDPNGKLVFPDGTRAPRVVPFSSKDRGPFNGGVL